MESVTNQPVTPQRLKYKAGAMLEPVQNLVQTGRVLKVLSFIVAIGAFIGCGLLFGVTVGRYGVETGFNFWAALMGAVSGFGTLFIIAIVLEGFGWHLHYTRQLGDALVLLLENQPKNYD